MFPGATFEGPDGGNVYWLVKTPAGRAVGFCSVRPTTTDLDTVFLSRAGILPEARGLGLHRRMISVRLRWARKNGFKRAITYAQRDNIQSAVNLLRCGFMLYDPDYRWVGDSYLYFLIDLGS